MSVTERRMDRHTRIANASRDYVARPKINRQFVVSALLVKLWHCGKLCLLAARVKRCIRPMFGCA